MTKNNSEKTLIILDTNFLKEGTQNNKIYSTLSSRTDFNNFITFLEKNNLKNKIIFGIPEITFEEHFYHKNQDFNFDLENLREKVSQFNQMEILENGKLDLKFKDSFDYKEFLNKFIETNDSFVLFKIPEDKKKELFDKTLKKAINHQRPFHKKGDRNLKDSLIWECICCQDFREYATVIFLTQNEDDFPKNNEIEEINYASEKTGKTINVLYKYNDLEKELNKIYMFVNKDLETYLLENKDRFAEQILNWIIEEEGIPVDRVFLLKPCEEIISVTNKDLHDIGFISEEEIKSQTDLDRLRFIKIEFETIMGTEKEKWLGEVLYDLDVNEVLHLRWDAK